MADPTPEQPSIAEQERRRFVADMEVLLDRADFRRVLWYLINDTDFCKAHGLSSIDPMSGALLPAEQVYYAEGRRSIGLALTVTMRKISPKAYMQMLNEAMGLRNQQTAPPVQVPQRK